MSNFADDNFMINWSKSKIKLISDMEIKLKKVIKWLTNSGLKVDESKTELCLFYKTDSAPVQLSINGPEIESTDRMAVLGVIFDSKLKWDKHVATAISKANMALNYYPVNVLEVLFLYYNYL